MSDRKKLIVMSIIAALVCFIYVAYGLNSNNYAYLLYRRIPRLVAMIIVAIAICVASGIFQTITNNRLLTPDLLGYSQLYIFIQTLMVFLLRSSHPLNQNSTLNFISVMLIMVVTSTLLFSYILKISNHYLYLLLLIGIIINTLFSSANSFLQMIIDPNEYLVLQNQLVASFNSVDIKVIIAATLILIVPLIWVYRRFAYYDVLLLGKDYAENLSVDSNKMYMNSLIVISILISVATALVGPIVFLGMLVINIARMSVRAYQHKVFMAYGVLTSILMVVAGQFVIDKVFNLSITLSVVINLVGGFIMIILIIKEKQA